MSVYFIQAGRYVKVGFSDNPERRFRRLFASNTAYSSPHDVPRDLASRTLLKVIDGDKNAEARIHIALDQFRVGTEWFIDEPELRAFIDTVETADSYETVTRPAGDFDRINDPVIGATRFDMSSLEGALSGIFSRRSA